MLFVRGMFEAMVCWGLEANSLGVGDSVVLIAPHSRPF